MMYRDSCIPREKLMNRINEVSFAVNDILLYLDTHPSCEKALNFYERMGMKKLREGDFPIGNGYYMNDFIMGLEIN